MTDDRNALRSGSPPREVLLRRLADAQAILGCGDDPDRSSAIEEIERLERALDGLDRARRDETSGEANG